MSARLSFLLKPVGALLLVALADLLFWLQRGGSTIGLFAFAMLLVLGSLRTEVWRGSRASLVALGGAALMAVSLAFDPGPLALLLFWTAATLAALFPRTIGFDHAGRWLLRLIVHGVIAPFGPLRDLILLKRAKRRRGGSSIARAAIILIVPMLGSLVFIALFAEANPLIEQALSSIDLTFTLDPETVFRVIFWGFILVASWSLLRPTRFSLPAAGPRLDPALALPAPGLASVGLSLVAFNTLFAIQNGLDLAFLWSGAPLPDGMTLAEYAHRGAYPLIATALLAGLFVLIALRPGSETAASRPIRWLVTFWIAQNLFLVASTMLRTFDYIEAYSLTRLRIAALIWMALVATGLVLICYRLLRAKSAAWLINANLIAAALVLSACTFLDLGAMAASWNVRHAREVGGTGAAIDLCYLNELGSSAALPLIELESRPLSPELRDRVAWLRTRTLDRLAEAEADWHGWTVRDARRLAAAEALVAEHRLPRHRDENRQCDGRPLPPPPLTPAPER